MGDLVQISGKCKYKVSVSVVSMNAMKGTVNVITSDPPCKDGKIHNGTRIKAFLIKHENNIFIIHRFEN